MKRFYKLVTTAPEPGGIAIHLDGKPVKTPDRAPLLAPNPNIADAIMAEWAAQKEIIIPDSMRLTQILTTAIDRVIPQRAAITQEVLNYLDTDLICYPAATPEELAALQAAQWDKIHVWFAQKYGVKLLTTTGLAALKQPAAAHEAVAARIDELDPYQFTAFQIVVATTGSLILGLALLDDFLDDTQIFKAAHIEEDYKAALYNEDFYGRAPHQEERENAVRADLQAARKFLELL